MSARDLAEITNLLAEYCLAADDCRFEDWARCFTNDGGMQGPADRARGVEELVRFISSARRDCTSVAFRSCGSMETERTRR